MSKELAIQLDIRSALKALQEKLGEYEQTSHGSGYGNECSIELVTEQFRITYDAPSSYNVSELSQRIGGFLRTEDAKQ